MKAWKTIRTRALLATLGTFLGLAVAELVLRLVPIAPGWSPATVTERQFSTIPGLFAPHQHGIDRSKRALPHVVTIDSLGYRGPEFPRKKRPDEFRILMVGDSFTFGSYVDDSATLPAQLGERLRRRCQQTLVINAGVGGTTITEETHMAVRALPLSPDLVILTFVENDVADLGNWPMWEQLASNRRAKSRFPLSAVYPILSESALWNLALAIRGAARAGSGPAGASHDRVTQRPDSSIARLRSAYTEALRALRDTLSASGIPLVLVIYPSHHALRDSTRRGQVAWATEVGVDLGLPTLSLLGSLQATDKDVTQLYLLPHDGHASPLGYATAADTLAPFIESQVGPRLCRS